MPGMAPQMQPAPLQIGSHVLGQWQDGNWYPGVIVAMENGAIGVDWANPQLGLHSWLQPQQVQPQPMMQQQPMMMQQQQQPMMQQQQQPMMQQQQQPMMQQQQTPQGKFAGQPAQQQPQKGHDPYAKGAADPYAKGAADPYAKGAADPYAKGAADPYAKGGAPAAKGVAAGSGVQVGTSVHAQHANGQWYPGRVVALQNGLIGVDWDDPKLGESIWVQPQQVTAK